MVDSLAPGVARGWRGFRHGGGYRGGKRGPSTLQRRAPREVGREKRGPREKRAEGSRSDEVAGKSGPAADPGPPKSKFTIVCSLWLRYSFSVYPFFGPFLVFLSSSLTLSFVHSLPDRAFPLSFLSPLLSNFFFFLFLVFCFARWLACESSRHKLWQATSTRRGQREKVERFDTLVSDSGPLPRLITISVNAPFHCATRSRAPASFLRARGISQSIRDIALEFGEELLGTLANFGPMREWETWREIRWDPMVPRT